MIVTWAFLIFLACCAAGFTAGWVLGHLRGQAYQAPKHYFPLNLDEQDAQHRGRLESDDGPAQETWLEKP